MKSAYERALERMQEQGIEKPDAGALSAEVKSQMAEVRSRAEARLAELEILHKSKAPTSAEDEENYRRERELVESRRDRELERLRRQTG